MALIASITLSSSPDFQRTTWRIGPKCSRSSSARLLISYIDGRDEMAVRGAFGSSSSASSRPLRFQLGKMRVERRLGLVVDHRADIGVEVAPDRRPSAPSSRRRSSPASNRRHRPGRTGRAAPSSAGRRSGTTRRRRRGSPARAAPSNRRSSHSGRRFRRSAGRSARRGSARLRLIARAVSVEPVKATPAISGCDGQRRADLAVARARAGRSSLGMPASCISSIASAPISGVCSAGLAMAALPAASAAATGPMKIASGKFHGQMQANTPRPCRRSSFSSPVGPGSGSRPGEQAARLAGVIAQEIDRLAHFQHRVGQGLPGLADAQRE